ncbi:MAG: hypothetical protein NWE89_01585 [Candidatus Bathyarchaeota archaeon]|nr:hypothetical protein [Candidatus Bathyarchaeota archaeon]
MDQEQRTSKPEYGPYILLALAELSEASHESLLQRIYNLMEDRLHPADHAMLQGGQMPRWMNQAEFMVDALIDDGYIREEKGKLSLTEKALSYLSAQQ